MLTNHIGLNVDFSQVVGRVHGEASMKVVERLNTTAVGLNDEPVQAMRVSDCLNCMTLFPFIAPSFCNVVMIRTAELLPSSERIHWKNKIKMNNQKLNTR
jgi:hypothetical protein